MPLISLQTAAALTGMSKRTLWRRIADGQLTKEGDGGGTMVELFQLAPIVQADPELVVEADLGDPEAMADLGMLCRNAGALEGSLYWLQRAAEAGHADAMHWLGDAYMEGRGVPRDANLGVMWVAKSASLGHPLSRARIDEILAPFKH